MHQIEADGLGFRFSYFLAPKTTKKCRKNEDRNKSDFSKFPRNFISNFSSSFSFPIGASPLFFSFGDASSPARRQLAGAARAVCGLASSSSAAAGFGVGGCGYQINRRKETRNEESRTHRQTQTQREPHEQRNDTHTRTRRGGDGFKKERTRKQETTTQDHAHTKTKQKQCSIYKTAKRQTTKTNRTIILGRCFLNRFRIDFLNKNRPPKKNHIQKKVMRIQNICISHPDKIANASICFSF